MAFLSVSAAAPSSVRGTLSVDSVRFCSAYASIEQPGLGRSRGAQRAVKGSRASFAADAPAAASDAPSALFPKRWKCVEGCGACCDLTPEDRPDLDKYLSPDELRTYMEMVGEDGWCKHYDREKRSCTVYDTRPAFCRVTLEGMRDRYGVPEHKADKFACSCCKLQIGAVYGYDSEEMARFKEAIGTQAEAAGKGPSRKKPTKKRRG